MTEILKDSKRYITEVEKISKQLTENKELFDDSLFYDFESITRNLKSDIQKAQDESRKLVIGIIGDVKAGKSSFLNACIFGGRDILPKAATPMTAALTKISYSETPGATIHFYSQEDWNIIISKSAKHDEELQKEYQEYCDSILKRAQQVQAANPNLFYPKPDIMDIDRFYKSPRCTTKNNEILRSAKELTKMANNEPEILDKLGGFDEISGDKLIEQLDNYVGANGKFTPIVKYVELQTNDECLKDNDECLKDLEIVDTPGLNDPIQSRSNVTREFLHECDVVLVLSPCSQFLNSGNISLIANRLPSEGVREIVVIGSKFDSGILNETSASSFKAACKKSIASYKEQYSIEMAKAKEKGRSLDRIETISQGKVFYVSSICFTIYQKLKNANKLTGNEETTYNNLKRFKDFDDKCLLPLSGIREVRKYLFKDVKARKQEYIEQKNAKLIPNAKSNHQKVLEKIISELTSSKLKLEESSAEELRSRVIDVRETIDLTREKLIQTFEAAINSCEDTIVRIKPEITKEISKHITICIETSERYEKDELKSGLFGLNKTEIKYKVIDKQANLSSVIENIHMYGAKCQELAKDYLNSFFNKNSFSGKIKNILLDAFKKSGKEMDEAEIEMSVSNVLAKIQIPVIYIDYMKSINNIETVFQDSKDFVEGAEIHRLINQQSIELEKIRKDVEEQLDKKQEDVKLMLEKQATSFADEISDSFCKELEKLEKQIEEKDTYIKKYQEFKEKLLELKKEHNKL